MVEMRWLQIDPSLPTGAAPVRFGDRDFRVLQMRQLLPKTFQQGEYEYETRFVEWSDWKDVETQLSTKTVSS